jgi:Domain of Unknown Function (DUF1080)
MITLRLLRRSLFVGIRSFKPVCLALLMVAGRASAEEHPEQVTMFNGKDLSGWEGAPGWWTVEDGALTSESTPEKKCLKPNYLVWTGGEPADFQLDCEFKLSAEGNSGIQIRSERRPNHDTFGYQADMTGDGKLLGYIYHHQHGLVAERGTRVTISADGKRQAETVADPKALLADYKPGDWNQYRIRCVGSKISIWINDVLMCDITDHSAKTAATKGFIGLQMHPGPPMKVQFRHLILTPLKTESKP